MQTRRRALPFFLSLCFIYGIFLHLSIHENVHHASDDCSYTRVLSTSYVVASLPNIECVFSIFSLTIFILGYLKSIFLSLKIDFYSTRAPPAFI